MNNTIAPTTKVMGDKKSVNSDPVLVREAVMNVSGKVIIFSILYFNWHARPCFSNVENQIIFTQRTILFTMKNATHNPNINSNTGAIPDIMSPKISIISDMYSLLSVIDTSIFLVFIAAGESALLVDVGYLIFFF